MKNFTFVYGIKGVRFYFTPRITVKASSMGEAEVEARNSIQPLYGGKEITYLEHV